MFPARVAPPEVRVAVERRGKVRKTRFSPPWGAELHPRSHHQGRQVAEVRVGVSGGTTPLPTGVGRARGLSRGPWRLGGPPLCPPL